MTPTAPRQDLTRSGSRSRRIIDEELATLLGEAPCIEAFMHFAAAAPARAEQLCALLRWCGGHDAAPGDDPAMIALCDRIPHPPSDRAGPRGLTRA
jgi:hypothetical protein